jgi:anti-sigma-K factor RskA
VSYSEGVDQLDIKRHGNWSSDPFWHYITSPFVASSPVASALAAAVATTNPNIPH